MNLQEFQIREFAKNKVKELQKEIDKWNKVLDAFGEQQETKPKEGNTFDSKKKLVVGGASPRLTINQMVKNVLNETETPLTSRDIMNMLNDKYDKGYTLDNFSGAFSSMYRKPKSGISQYNFQNPTLEVKAVYGLDNWFLEENVLKEEYKERLVEKYGNY